MPNQKPKPAQANERKVEPATSRSQGKGSPQPSQQATDPDKVTRAAEKQQVRATTMQAWLDSEDDRLQWFMSYGGGSHTERS